MKDLTIIIPVHEYNKEIEKLLKVAIKTVEIQIIDVKPNLLIVCPDKIKINIKNENINITKLINPGDTSYQNQVNYAVKNIKTKYFSVLEFDDEISKTYLKNVNSYITHYPDVDVYLPLIVETNKNNEALKLTNELVWSQQNVGEGDTLGFLSVDTLETTYDFKLSGAVIKKESFLNVGGYKTKIEVAFMYEFLMRALNNGLKVMTIPKVIYKHFMDRDGNLFTQYKEMGMDKIKRWYDIAKKESNFNEDREIDLLTINKENNE